jgi:hypothetical protein
VSAPKFVTKTDQAAYLRAIHALVALLPADTRATLIREIGHYDGNPNYASNHEDRVLWAIDQTRRDMEAKPGWLTVGPCAAIEPPKAA